PRWINEGRYLDKRACRTYVLEYFSMGAGGVSPFGNICQHDARSDDVGDGATRCRDCLIDDFEASSGLLIDVAGRSGKACGRNRRGPCNSDELANPHGTAEADLRFEI